MGGERDGLDEREVVAIIIVDGVAELAVVEDGGNAAVELADGGQEFVLVGKIKNDSIIIQTFKNIELLISSIIKTITLHNDNRVHQNNVKQILQN